VTPRFTLVLGAGGTVGLAYHAGVLKALSDIAGIEAADAELIIGTSAGSVAGAYLRSGYSSDDFWQLAMGTHPSLDGVDQDTIDQRRRALFTPAWASGVDMVRRGIGSWYALLRSVTNAPGVPIPALVRRQFPAGMFTMASGKEQLEEELPSAWPSRPLWLCAFDIVHRRRVVLGRDEGSQLTLPWSVLASCAIPGVYRPVRDGRRVLVDGGVTSTTNLDLAALRTPQLVIAVAPMAFDPRDAPSRGEQLTRRRPAVALSREARTIRDAAHDLVILRPCRDEIRAHGRNLMRLDSHETITQLAYDCTAETLEALWPQTHQAA
jgi:NTE family protein